MAGRPFLAPLVRAETPGNRDIIVEASAAAITLIPMGEQWSGISVRVCPNWQVSEKPTGGICPDDLERNILDNARLRRIQSLYLEDSNK
jgi:hypothetical protein